MIALAASRFPGGILAAVGIVFGCGLAATLLFLLGQLVWAWLQAPMRMLTEDVIAIRERLEQLSAAPAKAAPVIEPINRPGRLLTSQSAAAHVEALEARLAAAEARIAVLEGRADQREERGIVR